MTNDSHQAKLNTLSSHREPDEHAHSNIQCGRNPDRRSETAVVEDEKAREKGSGRGSESIGEVENAHRNTEVAEGPDHVLDENRQRCAHERRRDQQQSEVRDRNDRNGGMHGGGAETTNEPGATGAECPGNQFEEREQLEGALGVAVGQFAAGKRADLPAALRSLLNA